MAQGEMFSDLALEQQYDNMVKALNVKQETTLEEGDKWYQEHGQDVGHNNQVEVLGHYIGQNVLDAVDLIQFLSMNQEFNGYGSVSKETAKHFLEQYKKSKQ